MEIMKPFDVTDTTLTSSSIAEPDIASGEVEWVDRINNSYFGSYTGLLLTSALANDGNIYCVGSNGTVVKIDVENRTVSEFGSYATSYNTCVLANDGNIYCVGNAGAVLKINVAGQSVSEFGSYTGTYDACVLADDGNIYCVEANAVVLKIDIALQSLSTFGSYTGEYTDATLANDGNIYCVGRSDILKINVVTQSLSTFGSYTGFYSSSTLADDGSIYCVGDTGAVLKINVTGQSVSLFGSNSGVYYASTIGEDRNIYCVGFGGYTLKINVATQTTEKFNESLDTYYTAVLAGDGGIYSVGSNNVMAINGSYNTGDEVVLTTESKIYKAATQTKDNPIVGVGLIPPTWVELRYTNKYRMFNDAKDSKSTTTTDIVTEFDFNKSVTTVATLGVIGTSVMVTVTDPVDGIVYEVEKETADAGVNDFWAFWFEPYTFREDLVFDNMPPGYPDTTVKVEVKATSGERAVGRVLSGLPVNIGVTNEPTTVGRQNFTLRTRDGFGNLTITPKRSIKVLNYDVAVNKNDLDSTDRILESVGKIPALYIGEGDLESMICFGMAEDYRMDHNSAFSNMRLEVKEI